MVSCNASDVEYLGSYVTKVRHYDEWDEWVKRTCTRSVPCGKDANGNTRYRTETYDCSYRDYHPERWVYFDNNGEEHWIFYEEEFNDMLKTMGNPPMVFVDMHRRYYRIDGDAQDYYWDNKREHIRTLTEENSYTNKIQTSKSIFNFQEISKKEAKELNLYEYPKVEAYDQTPILSDSLVVDNNSINAVKFINGFYGKSMQFRLYLLIYMGKDIEISELQRAYWVGGNKNELVVCLGMSDSTHVDWCNAWSWCDAPTLEVKTESWFAEHDSLDVISYANYVEELLLDGNWERKEFSDFDYVKVEVSSTQEIILLILITLYNIGISIFIILNRVKYYR